MDANQINSESIEFAQRIKELRKELGLTQSTFGEKIGLTQNTITKYENGLRNASNQIILSICREFDVNEDWLRNGTGSMFRDLDRDEEIAIWASKITRSDYDIPFAARFVHALSRLDEKDWEVLEKLTLMLHDPTKKD